METLNPQDYAWAKRCGLTDERIVFLLACPKYTRSGKKGRIKHIPKANPNHHLQKLGNCFWFRLRRHGSDVFDNVGPDLTAAREERDRRLTAFAANPTYR